MRSAQPVPTVFATQDKAAARATLRPAARFRSCFCQFGFETRRSSILRQYKRKQP